ncbi:lysine--tRNA ligase, partial [Tanacetum coccineum]
MGTFSRLSVREAGSNRHTFRSPLQGLDRFCTLKYIDSNILRPRRPWCNRADFWEPIGNGIKQYFSDHGQFYSLDFILGDAYDRLCGRRFVVYLQVGNTIWNFTTRSIGVGSSEKHSVTFKADFSHDEPVPIAFTALTRIETSDPQVATMTKSAIQERSGANNEDLVPTVATLRKPAVEERSSANNEDMDPTFATVTKSAVQERPAADDEDMDHTVAAVTKSAFTERSAADDEDMDPTVATVTKLAVQERSAADVEDMDPTNYFETQMKTVDAQKDARVKPYPHFKTTSTISEFIKDYEKLRKGERLEDVVVSLAGRIMSKQCPSSKLYFYDLHGSGVKVQVMVDAKKVEKFTNLHKSVKIGDIVGIIGFP